MPDPDRPSNPAADPTGSPNRVDHPRPVRRLCAVLPAAGESSRMGRPKLLLPFGDDTILGAVVSSLSQGGVGEIALVVPPGAEGPSAGETPVPGAPDQAQRREGTAAGGAEPARDRGTAARLAAWGRERGLVVAENPRPERGMLSTVLCGLQALGGAETLLRQNAALLVTPADLPALGSATVGAIASALRDGARLAVPLHAGRRGHPLGIAPDLLGELEALDPDVGLRQLLDRHPDAVVEVPVDDPGSVRDVDTPADYRALTGRDPEDRADRST